MMTVHVLHAGDGYTYLTRQVASGDVAREQGDSLSDYYTQDGNPPGRWVGTGLAGLGVEGQVDEVQMKALFGEGRHPDADRLERELVAQGASPQDAMKASQLGRRFPRFAEVDDDGYEDAMRAAYAQFRVDHDRSPEVGVERDLIRWNVATSILRARVGGALVGEADIARFLAARGQSQRQPVAGYDLVFTPAKSVSTLWGLGNDEVRVVVEQAHEAAWRQTLAWLESEAALTRVGAGGVAQIETKGLVATAFDHHDSRTGDPNLHTHVAVSNKVQGADGKWRALDGRVLHALGVAASERYNTIIEMQLREHIGVEFVEERRGNARQPVREVAGISQEVRAAFSSRRAAIEEQYEELVAGYRAQHGHEPPRAVQFRFAQQATLETRARKEEGVGLGELRRRWREAAAGVLGSPQAVDRMLATALAPEQRDQDERPEVTVEQLAQQVLIDLAQTRSVWSVGNVQAEAQRLARSYGASIEGLDVMRLGDDLAAHALRLSAPLSPPDLNPVPAALRRADGESVYLAHATQRFTSMAVLDAEDRLVSATQEVGGLVVAEEHVTSAITALEVESGRSLNAGQREVARRFAAGGHVVEAGIGPAGAGKTTAMSAFARAIGLAGGRVIGLAPSAAAAAVLGEELAITGETIHKLLHAHGTGDPVPDGLRLDASTVVLVDEAGMASTPDLDALVALARQHGASVRLLGDPAQLQAVGAGGVLRLIDTQVGAAHLQDVHRFATPGEAEASLLVREGDARGLDFYVDAGRTLGGTREAVSEDLYAAWWTDTQAGKTSVMIAATNEDVARLSMRAHLDRVAAGDVEVGGVELRNDATAGVGDTIVTRLNARSLRVERGTDFVKNGDVWTVVERGEDGALRVQHTAHRGFLTLPAEYVAEHVDLSYAATIHRVQGMTVDTSHSLMGEGATREQLYTATTRGREANRVYVITQELLEVDVHDQPGPTAATRAALEGILARTDATPSATATLDAEYEHSESLARLVPEYEDAWARLVDVDRDEHLSEAVRQALPEDLAAQVLDDDAWPALRAQLAEHERSGADVVDLLTDRAGQHELQSSRSVASVLHHRVGEVSEEETERTSPTTDTDLPRWITQPPADDVAFPVAGAPEDHAADQEIRSWVSAHARLISARLDTLVDDVARTRPDWAQPLSEIPDDPIAAVQWRTQMRRIVAYRDRYAVTGDDAVPTRPSRGVEEKARADAAAALDELSTTGRVDDHQPDVAASQSDVVAAQRAEQRARTRARLEEIGRRSRTAAATTNPESLAERARRLLNERSPEARPDETPGGPRPRGPQM